MPIITFVDNTIPVAADFNGSFSFINTEVRTYERGGTGQSSYAAGDLIYASATNTLAKLTAGVVGSVLGTSSTGVPSYSRVLSKDGADNSLLASVIFTLKGGTLGTANRVRCTMITAITNNSGGATTFQSLINYGLSPVVTYNDSIANGTTSLHYPIIFEFVGHGTTNVQLGVIRVPDSGTTPSIAVGAGGGTSSFDTQLSFSLDPGAGSLVQKYVMVEVIQ